MNTGKLYGLDHLRALAITMVFLFHYQLPFFGHPAWLKEVAKFGWTGVDLFFVLSGFLISSQLFVQIKIKQKLSIRDFFVKRIFRILPAFWVTVAVYFCISAFHEREALPSMWKFLFFVQNFGLDIKIFGTFSHAWSLCVEEHFYLFLPLVLSGLLFLKFFKKGYLLLITLFLLGFLIRNYNWNLYFSNINQENSWQYWYKYIYYPTYNRLDGLLVGVSIAAVREFSPIAWKKITAIGNWLFIAGLLVLTGAYFICYEEKSYIASVFGFSVVAFGYGLLVIAALSPSNFLFKQSSGITTLIAALSYSVYLTHKGIIHITQGLLLQWDIDINNGLTLLISIVTCIIGALILNLLVEKPFMKLRKKVIIKLNKN